MTRRPQIAVQARSFDRGERLRRIETAEEAGFIVVRSRTIELPDGRRLHGYTPYDEADDDED